MATALARHCARRAGWRAGSNAQAMPRAEFVPVWIENLGRVMPKGAIVPVPLLCTLTFGAPLTLSSGETKAEFLERARAALLDLAPPAH